MRHPVILTSKEEDFRAIGLLPPLTEADDPSVPRDVPSPAPETLDGLDDSEGEKSAHSATAKQPKPKMGPPADDASVMDPEEDGGSAGAQKSSGSSSRVQGSKEASVRAESAQYMKSPKQPMKMKKGKNAGQKAKVARGLPAANVKIGMVKEGRYATASTLIEEVQDILGGLEMEEEISQILRSFQLVAENAALVADRLTEISDRYKVESVVSDMEELSQDAVEALEAVEAEIEDMDGGSDEDQAVAHSSDVSESDEAPAKKVKSDRNPDEPYDVPSPAFKEDVENILQVMVGKLMDAVEVYDAALDHMNEEDDGDPRHEIHIHTKAHNVHVHHSDDGDEDDGADMGDPDDDMADADMEDPDADMGDEDAEMMAAGDDGGDEDPDMDMDSDDDMDDDDMGAEDDDMDDESDAESNSLMARMKALRTRREAMGGGRPFRK